MDFHSDAIWDLRSNVSSAGKSSPLFFAASADGSVSVFKVGCFFQDFSEI